MRSIRHHLHVYLQLLSYSLKYIVTYRINMLVQLGYTIVYYLMLYTIIYLIYNQTPTLGGWTRPEIVLLFWIFLFMYNLADSLYLRGAYLFMKTGVELGDFDRVLTKPMQPSLLVMWGTPNLHLLIVSVVSLGVAIVHMNQLMLNPLNIFIGILAFGICFATSYFILSTYTTLAFFVTRSVQVFHTLEKVADFSQYPATIFPRLIEISFFTVLPIALYGYVPTLFLLGKGSLQSFSLLVGLCGLTFFLQRLAWKEGVKRYSSASS
jgi:ABC-2 type transport system permease protein